MKKYIFAQIDSSFYEVVFSDEPKSCPDGFVEMKTERTGVDYIANKGGEWVTAPAYVPQVLSRFQALTVLKLTKINETTSLYQAADDYINSLSGKDAKEIVIKTAWETASEFRRDSTLINTCKEMFGLTDEQVDEMFRKGAALEV